MTRHADLETLSAVLDGEPESSHVQGCTVCRGRLAELRMASEAVAQPVAPPPDDVRERAIARALAAAAGEDQTAPTTVHELRPATAPRPAGSSTSRRWWLAGSAAAAVAVVVVGAAALMGVGGSHRDTPSALTSDAATEKATGSAPTDQVFDADLGDVATVDALRAKVAPALRSAAPAAPAAAGATSATAESPVAAPRQVGTRVCEIEARTARPQLGFVVYAGNLRFQGTPAVVLGFAPTPAGPPETLVVLAPQQGCPILAETAPS